MKPELLVTKAIYEPTLAALERDFTIHRLWTQPEPDVYVRQSCGNVRAAITTTPSGFSRADFEALPKLDLLACFGPYYTLIDLAVARERNVAVTYTPGSTAEPVADLAMGMIIAVMRRLCEGDRFVRAGKWSAGVFASGTEVRGKTLGIIGFGRIARELAKRAASFGMSICYHGPRVKDGVHYFYFDNLESMAREADCLVVTCALTAQTRNLVDARILAALGPEGFLVNVARGAIVGEEALIAALEKGQIAGAALDVFTDEPQVPAALLHMENVVLAPHIGTSTREVREGRSAALLADMQAYLASKPLVHPVPA